MNKFCFLFSLYSACFSFSYAQTYFGLKGIVTDKDKSPVRGALVHLLNTNYAVFTNAQGFFSIADISSGIYIVRVSAMGYAAQSRKVKVDLTAENLEIVLQPDLRRLSEVTVISRKREEPETLVPESITSLSSREIEAYRLWDIKEVTAIAPNLYIADPGDKRNVTAVRGIVTTSYDQAVATYVDGVNQFSLDTYIPQLFDVDHIEVIKGPQGTLYGRNAMGGVINIITKRPDNATHLFATADMGRFGRQRYTVGLKTALLKDKLYFGAAGLYESLDGFYTNQFNGEPYDRQYSFGGNYFLKYFHNRWEYTFNFKHVENRNEGPFPLVMGVEGAFKDPFQVNQNALTKLVDNTLNLSLSVNYKGNALDFTSQTAYQSNYRYYTDPIDADFSPLDGMSIINNYGTAWNHVKALTEELRVTSPARQTTLRWIAGAYLFYYHNPVKQATRYGRDAGLLGIPETNFIQTNTTKAESLGMALFGHVSYKISPKVDLSGGLRYDYESKDQHVSGIYQKDLEPVMVTWPDTAAKADFSALTSNFGMTYLPSQNQSIYFTYSSGFRSGGLTPLSSDPSQPPLYAYKPEHSNNFEAGIKAAFFGNRIRTDFDVFYTQIRNVQVPTLILPEAVTIIRNTGKLNSKGFEVSLKAKIINGLMTDYSLGYTDAVYDDLMIVQRGITSDLKGNRQIFTPDITSMLALQYTYLLNRKYDIYLVLRGEWRYLGMQYFDLANTISQSPYSIFNTRFGLESSTVSIFFWARNTTDTRYISYAYDFGGIHLGNPRIYGVTVSVHYERSPASSVR